MDFFNTAFCIAAPRQSFFLYLMLLLVLNAYLVVTASLTEPADAGEGVPPKISQDVVSKQKVREGTKSFRLTCPVKGDPEPLIHWKKNGESIGPGWSQRVRIQHEGKVLRIRNVHLMDSGHYTCEAVNGFGLRVVEYTLIVHAKESPWPPLEDKNQPVVDRTLRNKVPVWADAGYIEKMTTAPIMTRIGSDIELKCHAKGHPRPAVQWFKDKHPVSVDYTTSNRWIYHLKDVSDKDTGRYTCRVYNTHGGISATFAIKVGNADFSTPKFDKPHPLNRTVRQGQTATFQCKVRSSVPPHIKWLKRVDDQNTVVDNSTIITAIGKFMVLPYQSKTVDERNNTYVNKLVMDNVAPKDSGWYICVVTSSVGHMVYRSAYLNVESVYQTRIGAPSVLVLVTGIVLIGIVLIPLMFIACAIVFLLKHKQKAAEKNSSGPGRPPPPTCPPPSLPYKNSTSPRRQGSNGYYPNQRYIVRTGGVEHFRNALGGEYRLYDAQASVPLNSSFVDERDMYEATPQPYEIDYEHSEVEFYPRGTGRLQPHPSLYSCR